MAAPAESYLALCRGQIDDKVAERAIAAFVDKGTREAFFTFFRELENLYEIISPDASLRPYIGDLRTPGHALRPGAQRVQHATGDHRDLMRKTEELVQKHAETEGLVMTLPVVNIDENVLASIRYDDPDPGKVINLEKEL